MRLKDIGNKVQSYVRMRKRVTFSFTIFILQFCFIGGHIFFFFFFVKVGGSLTHFLSCYFSFFVLTSIQFGVAPLI